MINKFDLCEFEDKNINIKYENDNQKKLLAYF